MPKRQHKRFNRPKKLFDSARIKEENELIKKYGLKNKREIWKADFAIEKIRNLAKKLITAPEEEKTEFIEKQKAKGFEAETIADVLGLSNEDYLKRRLESVVVAKKLATTPKQARQFITHRHIKINGKIINSPSHLTTLDEEAGLELDLKMPVKKQETTSEEEEFLKETALEKETEEKAEESGEEETAKEENKEDKAE